MQNKENKTKGKGKPVKQNLLAMYERDKKIIDMTERIQRENKSINTYSDALKYMCNRFINLVEDEEKKVRLITLKVKGSEIIETTIVEVGT